MISKHFDKNYYTILGLEINATIQDIKSAYREKSKEFHPDHGGSIDDQIILNISYEILSNPIERSAFDQYLSQLQSSPGVSFHYRKYRGNSHSSQTAEYTQSSGFNESEFESGIFERMFNAIKNRVEEIHRSYKQRYDRILNELKKGFYKNLRNFWFSIIGVVLLYLACPPP